MSSPVEKIKERLDIVEVVGTYLELQKAGANFKAKCPFHNEKSPSFFVSPSRSSFYCFGCGAKGDIFSFVQEFEGVDFKGALKTLATRAGVELVPERPEEKNERDRLHDALEEAGRFYESNLKKSEAAKAYLKDRGLSEETVSLWRIGFALPEWRTLKEHLSSKGFSDAEMQKAGLVKRAEKEGKTVIYDTFRSRIMFPIFDSSGRVIAFSGRIFGEEDGAAKYLNSPDGPLFNKSEVLYGFDKAKLSIRPKGYTIIVEGQVDLVMAHQAGYGNTVATSGTALTELHLEKLRKLSPNLIMAFDGDSAGLRASKRGFELALSLGMNVRIAHLPDGLDPADAIRKDKSLWHDALKESKHIVDVYTDILISKNESPFVTGKKIVSEVLPLVKTVESAVTQAAFISKIAHKAKIREEALWEELKKLPKHQAGAEKQTPARTADTKRIFIERKLFGLILWQEKEGHSDFQGKDLRKRFWKVVGEKKQEIEPLLEAVKDDVVFEAEATYGSHPKESLLKIAEEMMTNLEIDYLKESYSEVMQKLAIAEQGKDEKKAEALLKQCHEIGQKLSELKATL